LRMMGWKNEGGWGSCGGLQYLRWGRYLLA